MESSMQKETGKAKMTLRKTFEGDLKKMELTWGSVEREAKRENFKERRRIIYFD